MRLKVVARDPEAKRRLTILTRVVASMVVPQGLAMNVVVALRANRTLNGSIRRPRWGLCRPPDARGRIHIAVINSPRLAGTLAHELTHAVQMAQRRLRYEPPVIVEGVTLKHGVWIWEGDRYEIPLPPYLERPWEQEAIRAMETLADSPGGFGP